jgi:hypothetical protein
MLARGSAAVPTRPGPDYCARWAAPVAEPRVPVTELTASAGRLGPCSGYLDSLFRLASCGPDDRPEVPPLQNSGPLQSRRAAQPRGYLAGQLLGRLRWLSVLSSGRGRCPVLLDTERAMRFDHGVPASRFTIRQHGVS